MRTLRWMYAKYRFGAEELYDLSTDPFELHNLAASGSVADELERLRVIMSRECRPLPPGFPRGSGTP